MKTLREALTYVPVELRFGTSGRRGKVVDLTQLEVYINVLAELEYLQSLPIEQGGIRKGDTFFLGHDLRPSSTQFAPDSGGRGEILQATYQAVEDAGQKAISLGGVPTPAVMMTGVRRANGSIMVTGSHIPFDRNGYKTNSSRGELRKEDEAPILRHVAEVRDRLYRQPIDASPFDERGMFKDGHRDLPWVHELGASLYLDRYLLFLPKRCFAGFRVLMYQHSAVGRDLLVLLLSELGAEVVEVGRSETFVPIDTENIEDSSLAEIDSLVSQAGGQFDAVVSTDGDSDRPLLLGFDDGGLRFFSGDLLGMVAAEYLGADAVVVPDNCNDAIDRGPLRDRLEPKTKIGSPYVIAGMEEAVAKGRRRVCGWEANGGFLLGSDIENERGRLEALPTRDAFLPILCALSAAKERGTSLSGLFDALPKRFSRAGLLKNVPREVSQSVGARLAAASLAQIAAFFAPALGFGSPVKTDCRDGVRIWFDNGDIAHVRPSGNADELRIYAVADTQPRADEIVRLGVASGGILERLMEAKS